MWLSTPLRAEKWSSFRLSADHASASFSNAFYVYSKLLYHCKATNPKLANITKAKWHMSVHQRFAPLSSPNVYSWDMLDSISLMTGCRVVVKSFAARITPCVLWWIIQGFGTYLTQTCQIIQTEVLQKNTALYIWKLLIFFRKTFRF